MKLPPLTKFTTKDLLRLYAAILDELKSRRVVRTTNNPVSGYTEWLVSEKLGLTLAPNSEKGFDAVGKNGLKYEIKARRITPGNNSRQLSAIRDLKGKHFGFLIAVIFDKDFDVMLALKIPHSVVVAKSSFVKETNSYRLDAKDCLKKEKGVKDITTLFKCG